MPKDPTVKVKPLACLLATSLTLAGAQAWSAPTANPAAATVAATSSESATPNAFSRSVAAKIQSNLRLPEYADPIDGVEFEILIDKQGYPIKIEQSTVGRDPGVIEAAISALVDALPLHAPGVDLADITGTRLKISVRPDEKQSIEVSTLPPRGAGKDEDQKYLQQIPDFDKPTPEIGKIYPWHLERLYAIQKLAFAFPNSSLVKGSLDDALTSVGGNPQDSETWISIGKGLISAAQKTIYSHHKSTQETRTKRLVYPDLATYAYAQALRLDNNYASAAGLKRALAFRLAEPFTETAKTELLKQGVACELMGDPCQAEDYYQATRVSNLASKQDAELAGVLLDRLNVVKPLIDVNAAARRRIETGDRALVSKAAPGPVLGINGEAADWRLALMWLPKDAETLIVSRPDSEPVGQIPNYQVTFKKFLSSLPGWAPPAVPRQPGAWRFPTAKSKIFAARQFKPPIFSGSGSYEGGTIELYRHKDQRQLDKAFADAIKLATINRISEGVPVYLIAHLSEADTDLRATEYLANPAPGVIMRANDPLFMAQLIHRIKNSGKMREYAFGDKLPEWKLIDPNKPAFGMRHYNRSTMACDMTAAIWDDEDREDWLCYLDRDEVGFAFDSAADGKTRITFLSPNTMALRLRQNRWEMLNDKAKHTVETNVDKDVLVIQPQSTRPKDTGLMLLKALGLNLYLP